MITENKKGIHCVAKSTHSLTRKQEPGGRKRTAVDVSRPAAVPNQLTRPGFWPFKRSLRHQTGSLCGHACLRPRPINPVPVQVPRPAQQEGTLSPTLRTSPPHATECKRVFLRAPRKHFPPTYYTATLVLEFSGLDAVNTKQNEQ